MSWPSCKYGPDGQAAVFACAEDVPAGWVDHPSLCQRKPKGGDLSTAIEAIEDAAAQIAKFDHDGDGHIGGSKPRKKAVKRDARK